MYNYWCNVFLLPKKLIKKLESLCSSFPWKGIDENVNGVKVSWDCDCKPRDEGELGIRKLED